MARQTLDQKLSALRVLDVSTPKAAETLRDALRSSSGLLIAAAAKLVAENRIDALADELPDAFERLLEDPAKRDPGCRGKLAIARALADLDRWEERVFVPGLCHIQLEGWGGPDGDPPDDTAAELRGVCGMIHAQFLRIDALDVLATLLTDDRRTTRIAAARGLGASRPDASALLRFKILTGDPDPDVIAACIESLLGLARESSLEFVLGLLDPHDDVSELVVLSLGGARVVEAFEPIVAWCMGATPAQRHDVAYIALALLRDDRANEYLLEAIRSHAKASAIAAARALATFKHDPNLVEQIRAAVGARKPDATVTREIDRLLE